MADIKIPKGIRVVFDAVTSQNGKAYLVGGSVRDALLGILCTDYDIEVYGIEHLSLLELLQTLGDVELVGQSFAVFKLRLRACNCTVDVSLPRRERQTGVGHRDFAITSDPTMSLTEACTRRDFTINSMAYNPIDNRLLDFFGGENDLHNGILRVTSSAFSEDPLRVLRGMQFAGRFGMVAAEGYTTLLQRQMKSKYQSISRERIWWEWDKWAVKSNKPMHGLNYLQQVSWLTLYPELWGLQFTQQSDLWHPEGDVWRHTKLVCQRMSDLLIAQNATVSERLIGMFSALLHDVGKIKATYDAGDGRWVAPGHAQLGCDMAKHFLEGIGAPAWLIDEVGQLIKYHMSRDVAGKYALLRLADKLYPATLEELFRLWQADGDMDNSDGDMDNLEELREMAKQACIERDKPKPIVMGRHLLDRMQPGPAMGKILNQLYQLQLDGEFETLEEGLVMAHKLLEG